MDYRDIFSSLDLALIEQWINENRGEDLFLDFKTVVRAEFSPEDRKNFAKALSGFANSAGGIIVWGVDARRDSQTGIDAAQSAAEIDLLPLFMAKLGEFTGSFVRPIVDGVQHRAIPREGSTGFAVTLVPESDRGPHMAMGGDGRYYKRSGASFYQMEHYDLEDMFGRRQRPSLRLHFRIERVGRVSGSGIARHRGKIVLGLENIGRGTARSPYVSFSIMPPYSIDEYGLTGDTREGFARIPHAGRNHVVRYGASPAVVIHPQMVYDVAAIGADVVVHDNHSIDGPERLYLDYEIAAEDFPLSRGTLDIDSNKLIRGILLGDE